MFETKDFAQRNHLHLELRNEREQMRSGRSETNQRPSIELNLHHPPDLVLTSPSSQESKTQTTTEAKIKSLHYIKYKRIQHRSSLALVLVLKVLFLTQSVSDYLKLAHCGPHFAGESFCARYVATWVGNQERELAWDLVA